MTAHAVEKLRSDWLTIDEAAKRTGLTGRAILQWAYKGKIISTKMGERVNIVYWPSVEQHIARIGRRRKAADPPVIHSTS